MQTTLFFDSFSFFVFVNFVILILIFFYCIANSTILVSPATATLTNPCFDKPFIAASHFLPLRSDFIFKTPKSILLSLDFNKSIINFSGSELHIINCDLIDISTDEFLGVLEKLVNLKKLVIIDMKRRFKDIAYNNIFFDKLPLLEIFMTDKDVVANSKSVKIIYSDN